MPPIKKFEKGHKGYSNLRQIAVDYQEFLEFQKKKKINRKYMCG